MSEPVLEFQDVTDNEVYRTVLKPAPDPETGRTHIVEEQRKRPDGEWDTVLTKHARSVSTATEQSDS
jgi:hypothetical protein